MPRRENTKPNRADVLASRMSIGSSMVAPKPAATPFTAAITGLRAGEDPQVEQATAVSEVLRPPRAQTLFFRVEGLRPPGDVGADENALPAPVTTTAPAIGIGVDPLECVDQFVAHLVVTEFSRSGDSA